MRSGAGTGFLHTRSAHDAGELIARWKRAGKEAGWTVAEIGTAEPFPIIALRSGVAADDGLYVSAGVHGDEPAPPWALLEWFEADGHRLQNRPMVIFPCLNPGGLVLNTRTDVGGADLNRLFHREDHPVVAAWRRWIGSQWFRLGLCLHEDYDGQGVYCYELFHAGHPPLASRLLARCEHVLPRDTRTLIDGRRVSRGVIRRSRVPRDLPGMPEAVVLHRGTTAHNLTFETPSEFAFDLRVHAHRSFLDGAVEWLGW